ncbi:MAG: histidinol-phosphate aminotransferase [Parcubacteria group bacterium Athens0416_74]|nr:MAG: histidinol-phosphate aminotransferase [Parcubacteria group bacterium Athens0416_74]
MQSERIIPLHQNESYWLLTDEMFEKYNTLSARDAATYPEYDALRDAFSRVMGVPSQEITLTAGSDAAIESIIMMCAAKGLRPLMPLPTFAAYELLCKKHALEYTPVYYAEENGAFIFPLDETIALIQEGSIDIIFLCQPNNPLGARIPHGNYIKLLDVARDASVTVVVDEAYAEFAPENDASYAADREMILLRTLSKSFGLAGLRIGCAIANPKMTTELSSRLLPWPIAHTSACIAANALADADAFALRRTLLIAQRDLFVRDLAARVGATVYESHANFVLIRIPHAAHIQAELAKEGILVALGESKSLEERARGILSSTLRLSVPSPEDHETVLSALERACSTRQ